MIYSKSSSSRRTHAYVESFLSVLFTKHESAVEIRLMPPHYTESCEGSFQPPDTVTWDKGRGSNTAHISTWEIFLQARKNCAATEDGNKMIVFEYDAFVGLPNAGELAIAVVRNMTTDLHYLGYCFHKPANHPRISKVAPYCLHAYAVTVTGAKILLDLVDPCGPFADVQLSRLADAGLIDWSYETQSYNATFVAQYFIDEGITMSGHFVYDGIFVQAKLDSPLQPLHDGALGNNILRGKEIHLLVNHTWHLVPNMEVLARHRLHNEDILTMTDWQFRTYAEGSPLSE